jgi:hypothetical protein
MLKKFRMRPKINTPTCTSNSKVSIPMLGSPVCNDRNSRSRTNLASDDGRLSVTISRETKELDNLLYLLLDKHKASPPHPLPAGQYVIPRHTRHWLARRCATICGSWKRAAEIRGLRSNSHRSDLQMFCRGPRS